MPLIKDLPIEEVGYDVAAVLQNARSEDIVKGRTLAAERLDLRVSSKDVTIAGAMSLDGVPLTVNWSQGIGAGDDGQSLATGRVTLSPDTLAALNVPLPRDVFGGRTRADFTLEIPSSGDPLLSLTSDLRGARIDFGGLGWSKSPDQTARFVLEASLGETIDVSGFDIDAPGLTLSGSTELAANNTLGRIALDKVKIGSWLDASADVGLGGAAPSVTLTGGRLDLRNLPDLDTGGGGGGRNAVQVALDELVVTDSIRLGPFRGEVTPNALGLSGDFQGRLNGGTVVRAVLAPTANGTGVRIQTNDAGGVLRDARLTPNARGGTLDIVMAPVGPTAPGTYNGQFEVDNIVLKDAPVMAALLDAVSVVGLVEQLSGGGLRFASVDGKFRMSPERLILRDVAATGASLGVSANGVYNMADARLDIEGVVSPFYFLNGLGQIVSRRGEGLFGVNYRVAGEVSPLSILTPGLFRQIFRRPPPIE